MLPVKEGFKASIIVLKASRLCRNVRRPHLKPGSAFCSAGTMDIVSSSVFKLHGHFRLAQPRTVFYRTFWFGNV